jgi:hypothetical protein
MENNEVVPVADISATHWEQFDLGQWLGRHQALALVANYCSAADAHALRTIREQKLYRTLGVTWEEFCPRHVGMSSRTAERIIENLEEFGESYFNLRDVLKIPAPEYRQIQPAIEQNTLEFEGRRIPINRENTEQLIKAVQFLRRRLEQETLAARSPVLQLHDRLDRMIGQINGAVRRCTENDRTLLLMLLEDHAHQTVDLARTLMESEEQTDDVGDSTAPGEADTADRR